MARMINKYESTAKKSGSILIPEIGVESAPAELVTWSLAKHNRVHFSAQTGEVVMAVHNLRYVVCYRIYSMQESEALTNPIAPRRREGPWPPS